jgi:prophage tail gpP-like protein
MSDIKIEVNGIQYTGFTEAIVTKSVQNLSSIFSFTTTVKEGLGGVVQNDLKVQDKVKIFIADDLYLTGKIEKLALGGDATNHTISVSGRDRIGDLVDSSIIKKSYNTRDFIQLIENVLADNGFSEIKVIKNTTKIDKLQVNLDKGETAVAQSGEKIGGFINRYSEKLSLLVYSNEDGNLIVTREGDTIASSGLLRQFNTPNSNILSSSINIDVTGRYKHVEVVAQSDNSTHEESSVNQTGTTIDPEITSERRIIIPQGTASKVNSLNDLAKWNVAIRRAKGARYNCKVQNFFQEGGAGSVWKLNTLVALSDDVCQVEGQFLIEAVTFRKTLQGTFSDLSIVNRGSFSVNYEDISKKSGDFAKNLINTDSS